MTLWHQQSPNETLTHWKVDAARGLTSAEASQRLTEFGANELREMGARGPWRILWEQLSGPMVILLIIAAIASAYLGEETDAIVIMAIVVLNAILGFVQDYRAERAMAALKKMAVPHVRVKRDGEVCEISARDLAPGDIVQLEVGNFVPADCRLLECVNLRIEEAALTGESEAVVKQSQALAKADSPLGDRTNMCYMGTVIAYGRGQGVVVETGMRTELGRIAQSLQTVEAEPTPLQQRLARLGRNLAIVAVFIVAGIFTLGILRGEPAKLMLMTAMSMAVAVVPEGLPAVATVALALGARRMFKQKALIRKLPAVETLGSVDVICSDKTGTLTENRMTVTILDVAGERLDVHQPDADLGGSLQRPSLALLLAGGGLCNDAVLEAANETGGSAVGDPTEIALSRAAARFGFSPHDLCSHFPRYEEAPFDSERKRMTTLHHGSANDAGNPALAAALEKIGAEPSQTLVFTKGAVDSLLSVCDFALDDTKVALDDAMRERILAANGSLAEKGMRVLGVAYRLLDSDPTDGLDHVEEHSVFVGMLGMIDPPRAEVKEAVARCRTAGIRPVMITGDHPLTARHIGGDLGIDDSHVLTGADVEKMSEPELRAAVEETSIYARVAPKHKLQLVQSLQANGRTVAMTGDGVNDAPALKQAHIGVAMGITGTDVSKESSQMILLDDNFATIVNAVEQGRIVYDNIRKFVKYTMTSNAGEIWVMVLGPLLGMPLPLLPLQILWMNLVTDGLPGLALAVEQAEKDTMRRPPHPPTENVMGRGMAIDIAWIGLLMGVVSLAIGYGYWRPAPETDDAYWRTILFTTLTFGQMGNALAIRSDRESLFSMGVFSNPLLVGSILLTFVLQLVLIYWPPLQSIFATTAIGFGELILCMAVSTIVFWGVEAKKWWLRNQAA